MRFTAPREHDRDASLLELARVDPRADERSLLVLYPESACSGAASAVLVDDEGRFIGAVAPGTAALLRVPTERPEVTVFSSVEVTAPVGMWHDARHVRLPRSPSGLVVRSARWSARECGSGSYFDVDVATKDQLEAELGESELRWVAPLGRVGQEWLDAHRRRVVEVLTTPARRPPGDLTHLILR